MIYNSTITDLLLLKQVQNQNKNEKKVLSCQQHSRNAEKIFKDVLQQIIENKSGYEKDNKIPVGQSISKGVYVMNGIDSFTIFIYNILSMTKFVKHRPKERFKPLSIIQEN